MSGKDMAENTLRLRLFPSACLRIALVVCLDGAATADLNLAGANGWLEED
jgi:hypothetical protein